MPSDPEISVVVSTRNRAAYLPACIEALAAQRTEASYEAVLIDNGSSDGTADVLRGWSEKDPRFRWAREERVGLSQGKNAGIAMARGRVVLFTDDDTLPAPDWIDAYRRFFARHPDGMTVAGGRVVPVPADLGPWPRWLPEEGLRDLALLDLGEERMVEGAQYVWGGNMAVPAALFDLLGTWDESVGRRAEERGTYEDAEFEDRLRRAGGSVWFVPEAEIRHRIARPSITPRRVAATAFDRGRNQFWKDAIPRFGAEGAVPAGPFGRGSLALGWHAIRWIVDAAACRVSLRRSTFRRARLAAWSAGHALERIRAGRTTSRAYRAAGRLTFGLRALALRMLPDVAG
jgi:glycosyltransferase involved in cell wall biosynthesis